MFAIPQLITVPALSGVGVMTIEWPMLGVLLAWALIAALVGSGLGALRRMSAQSPAVPRPRALHPRVREAAPHVDSDHGHLEAA
jgi:hypothetical protein